MDHNRLIAIFYLVIGVFLAIAAVFSLLFAVVSFLMMPARGTPEMIGNVIGILIGFFIILLLGLPALIAGHAGLKHKPWSRIAYIVAGIFALFGFPLGTALGIYTLWFVF